MSATELTHETEANAAAESDQAAIAIPSELDSSGSKLVYLYLNTVDEATIEDLQTTLNMPQLALFPVLETLEDADLVDHTGRTYTAAA